jgi:hypothetical protein
MQQGCIWRALLCNRREHGFIVGSHPMRTRFQTHRRLHLLTLCSALAVVLCALPARAQSVCSSDGQAQPQALLERFINAECDTCWSDPATPPAPKEALALDWIVPSPLGDAAALSAAASRDALWRLESLHQDKPATQTSQRIQVTGWPGANLRVAHGVALGGYLGASIEMTLPQSEAVKWPLQAWLVLVETLPPGVADSPVSRNLIRNVLQPIWNMGNALLISEQMSFKEMRAMNIPEGVNPQRLRVVGWVQDASGKILTTAESSCPPEE